MKVAKLFENDGSQVVILPEEYRFQTDEVNVNKVGDVIMLIPKECKWNGMIDSLDMFTDDFMVERNQGELQKEKSYDAYDYCK